MYNLSTSYNNIRKKEFDYEYYITTLNAKYIHTNLAIRCFKAYAMPEYNPIIAEYTIKDPTINIVSDLYQKKPDIVGFSFYIWNIEETIKVIRMLKKVKPDVKIIVGGPEVTYDYDFWLDRVPEIDVIVIGEGERTFKHLLDVYAGKDNIKASKVLLIGKVKLKLLHQFQN